MPGAFLTDDLADFFDADEFGITATFSGGDVLGILDRAYIETEDVAGYAPTFIAKTSDLSTVSVGDSVTIDSVVYDVAEIQPDGTGVTTLVLQLS